MTNAVLEVSSILNQLLSRAGLSEAGLGRKIGVPRATINRIASGRTPDPRASTLKAIAEHFHVTVDQLLGNEPLYKPSQTENLSFSNITIPIIEWGKANIWGKILKDITPKNYFDWVLIDSKNGQGKFALRTQGESMWPQFQENTLLIIDPTKEPKNRDFIIVYVKKNDELLFRQLIVEGKYQFIKAINKIFPTIELQESDKIIGVVIQTRNHLN